MKKQIIYYVGSSFLIPCWYLHHYTSMLPYCAARKMDEKLLAIFCSCLVGTREIPQETNSSKSRAKTTPVESIIRKHKTLITHPYVWVVESWSSSSNFAQRGYRRRWPFIIGSFLKFRYGGEETFPSLNLWKYYSTREPVCVFYRCEFTQSAFVDCGGSFLGTARMFLHRRIEPQITPSHHALPLSTA